MASVISTNRSPAAAISSRSVSGARWMLSMMAVTKTSARESATPDSPGSRGAHRRIALKMCVTARAPRS